MQKAQTDEAGISLRMTASAARSGDSGWVIEALVYIPPGQVRFKEEPQECRTAKLKWQIGVSDLQPMDYQVTELVLCGATARNAVRSGLAYSIDRRVRAPGAYDFRVDVQDLLDTNERSGSVLRRVEIPDLATTGFALSGIALHQNGAPTPAGVPAKTGSDDLKASYWVPEDNDPAVRRFRPGSVLAYDLRVFRSPPVEGKTVDMSLTVSRNGAAVHTERVATPDNLVHGIYRLDENAEAGSYQLRIAAAGAGEQSVDFEVAANEASAQPCLPAALAGNPPQPEASSLPSTLAPPAPRLDAATRMALLVRVRERMREAVLRIPDFTCTEEIVRTRLTRNPPKRLAMDRARLEVAVADGKELFAWPGQANFEQDDPSQIVRGGMTTTGDYAYFTRNVFGADDVLYGRGIEQELLGHAAVRYDYRIPGPVYEIRHGSRSAKVSLHGSFWVDTKTEEVLALAVMADNIPEAIGISGITSVLAFRPVLLNGRNYPLPASAEITARPCCGNEEVQNRIEFHNCRRYTGESRLIFTDNDPGSVAAAAQSSSGVKFLNSGLTLDLVLDKAVEAASAAAGDRISATLASPVALGNSIIPAGARVTGRLLNFEFDFESGEIRASLEFHRLEFDESRFEFRARLRSAAKMQGLRWIRWTAAKPVSGGSLWLTDGITRIPAGLHMKWETVNMR